MKIMKMKITGNTMAEYEFDTKLDYFDRVERATGAFSEFSNQDR